MGAEVEFDHKAKITADELLQKIMARPLSKKKSSSSSISTSSKDQKRPPTFMGYVGNIANMPKGKKYSALTLAVVAGLIHWWHVGSLFENDRHFSHLSTLEREMTFRTEMGMYYSYFKTVVEAHNSVRGALNLLSNNATEYPTSINCLKRFNLYPELILGLVYRVLNTVGILPHKCFVVNRGEGLSPVESCEGLGDPSIFYINAVWAVSSFTTTFLFLIATELSDSILGGVVATAFFFFNHSECTRVQWTPPLRESFAFPMALVQMFMVILYLRSNEPKSRRRPGEDELEEVDLEEGRRVQVTPLTLSTIAYVALWQFGQFPLFTQLCSLYVLKVTGVLSRKIFGTYVHDAICGVILGTGLMFFNEMLLMSWFGSALLTCMLLLRLANRPFRLLPAGVDIVVRCALLPLGTVATKTFLGKAFRMKDDAHIMDILRAKFTNFKSFHTLLYTCAKEFDFLGWEMPEKATKTLLFPAAFLAGLLVAWQLLKYLANELGSPTEHQKAVEQNGSGKHKKEKEYEKEGYELDASMSYMFLQTTAYGVMAATIMRLKLFWTPNLCIMAGMLASKKLLSPVVSSRQYQVAFVTALLAAASYQGVSNIREQRSIMGE